jgi:hypothetical protein
MIAIYKAIHLYKDYNKKIKLTLILSILKARIFKTIHSY